MVLNFKLQWFSKRKFHQDIFPSLTLIHFDICIVLRLSKYIYINYSTCYTSPISICIYVQVQFMRQHRFIAMQFVLDHWYDKNENKVSEWGSKYFRTETLDLSISYRTIEHNEWLKIKITSVRSEIIQWSSLSWKVLAAR